MIPCYRLIGAFHFGLMTIGIYSTTIIRVNTKYCLFSYEYSFWSPFIDFRRKFQIGRASVKEIHSSFNYMVDCVILVMIQPLVIIINYRLIGPLSTYGIFAFKFQAKLFEKIKTIKKNISKFTKTFVGKRKDVYADF